MTKLKKMNIKKILIATLCVVMSCIIGISVTFRQTEEGSIKVEPNEVQAATTVSEGWQPGTDINNDYHLLKTVTDNGDGTYDVDVYAANIEHAGTADVFIIWDNSNSMYTVTDDYLDEEQDVINRFINSIRTNFTTMNIRLSDFGSLGGNDKKKVDWTSISTSPSYSNHASVVAQAFENCSTHVSGSQFQLNLATANSELTARSADVKIVFMVSDGIPASAGGMGFNENLADDAVENANTLKDNNIYIFTVCATPKSSSLEKYTKGKNLMSQIATNSGCTASTFQNIFYSTDCAIQGTYTAADAINVSNFTQQISLTEYDRFTSSTWLVEGCNSEYFTIVSEPEVTAQKFTTSYTFGSDYSLTEGDDYVSTYSSGSTRFMIKNYNYVTNSCYVMGGTAHGSRLHLHYSIKAKEVESSVEVNTNTTSGAYIDFYDNGWQQLTLPGDDVTLSPSYYYISYDANGGSGSMSTQSVPYGFDTYLTQNSFTRNFRLTYVAGEDATVNSQKIQSTQHVYGVFQGWAETASGVVKYANQALVKNIAEVGETKTLYAKYLGTTTLLTPTKDNYTFVEWNTKSDGTGVGYDAGDSFSMTTNSTLYAIWSPKTFTLHYNLNGGTGTIPDQTGDYINGATITSTEPTKTRYTFIGWTENTGDIFDEATVSSCYEPGDTIGGQSNPVTADDVYLYAIWRTMNVFSANKGTFSNGKDAKVVSNYVGVVSSTNGTYIDVDSVEIPTRTGYTFKGWNTIEDGNGSYVSGSQEPGSFSCLYAIWEKVPTYTITYDANGNDLGSVPTADTKTQGVELSLSFSPYPYKEGYTFVGWSENSSATEPTYTASSNNTYTKDEAITLYAITKINTYAITYNANGGEGAPAAQIKTHDINIGLSSIVPTREHYTFVGWSEDPDTDPTEENFDINDLYQPGEVFTYNYDADLYAVWEEIKYTVTYDYTTNGGTSVDVGTKEFVSGDTFDASPVAIKDGWEFLGWSDTPNGIYAGIADGAELPDNDITVYAVYRKELTANFCSADTYDSEAGTDTPIKLTTYVYNNDTSGRFTVPSFTDVDGNDKYVKGEIEKGYTATGKAIKRGEDLTPEACSNLVYVSVTEGTATFDAVYEGELTLHYNANGGSEVTDTSSLAILKTLGSSNLICADDDSYVITAEVPNRNGYTFAGWTIPDATFEYQRYFGGSYANPDAHSSLLDGDTTAIAQWITASITSKAITTVSPGQLIEYTVEAQTTGDASAVRILVDIPSNTEVVTESDMTILNSGKNIVIDKAEVKVGETITKTFYVTIKDTVADEEEITAKATMYADTYLYDSSETSNIIKTLTYEAPEVTNIVGYKYKVTYIKNAGETGEVPVDSTDYAGGKGETATVKNNTLSKEGYTFVGWLDADNKVAYKEGAKMEVNGNINLSALWGRIVLSADCDDKAPGSEITYTIDIELPDYVDSVTIKDVIPEGVDFDSFDVIPVVDSSDEDEDEEESGEGKSEDEGEEITTEKFNVTYVADEFFPGSNTEDIANKTEQVLKNSKASEPTYEDDNYAIVCWYTDNSYDGTIDRSKVFNFNTPITSDTILYAIWEEKASITYHTVTVHIGDHGEAVDPVQVADGAYMKAPTYQIDGNYYICAWYVDDTFTDIDSIVPEKIFNFSTPITQDTDIYACWEESSSSAGSSSIGKVINNKAATEGESDTTDIELTKVDGINKYQVIIKAKINDNIAPGTDIEKQVTMETSTGYDVISNSVNTTVGYIITYIVGDNYTASTYLDGSVKYEGTDVLHNTDEDGNIIYYQSGEKAKLLKPEDKDDVYFIEWNTSNNSNGVVYDGDSEVTLLKNLVLYEKYLKLTQTVEDKAVDYIPGETYKVLVTVAYSQYLSDDVDFIKVVPKTGTKLTGINIDSGICKNTELKDDNYLVTADLVTVSAEDGLIKYTFEVEAEVTDDAKPGTETGCDIMTGDQFAGKYITAAEDNVDINNYFKVIYDVNGGTGDAPVDTVCYRGGETATILDIGNVNYTGYSFSEWNTGKTGEGVAYQPGDVITLNSDITMYATWRMSAVLPFTGSQTIALITFLSVLSLGLYFAFRKKHFN